MDWLTSPGDTVDKVTSEQHGQVDGKDGDEDGGNHGCHCGHVHSAVAESVRRPAVELIVSDVFTGLYPWDVQSLPTVRRLDRH